MSGISFNPDDKKISNINIGAMNVQASAQEKIKTALGSNLTKGPNKDLENSIEASILNNNTLPTEESLGAKGFEKSAIMDTNGGHYYRNEVTGESVRINSSWSNSGKKCCEYKRGNMQHSVIYDKNGRAISGDVQIKKSNGMMEIIKYEIDKNGNKIITSVSTEKSDSFYSHDGGY